MPTASSTAEKIVLSPEHVGILNRAIRRAEAVLPVWDKLEACGVDCQERRQILDEALRQARLLLMHFAPPQQGQRD